MRTAGARLGEVELGQAEFETFAFVDELPETSALHELHVRALARKMYNYLRGTATLVVLFEGQNMRQITRNLQKYSRFAEN